MNGRTGVRIGVRKVGFLTLSSCAALVAASGPVMAQTAPTTAAQPAPADASLEDIIVTAQKRSENLQNVPVAVAAFSAQTLQSANVSGVADLVSVTPSLRYSFAAQSGSPFLRGVGSDQTFPGAEAEVQTYIDGVYYGSGGAAYAKFNNIERVEVDKGPQGTLFGRNATGGVIQITTRDPGHEPKFDASVGYGRFNAKDADLYASTGLGDKVAADIAVHYEDHDGWGRNTTLNRDAFTAQSIGVRSKFVIEAADTTRLTLIGDYGRDKSDLGTSLVILAAPWRPTLASPIPVAGGKYTTQGETYSNGTVTHYGASLKIEQKIGRLSFVSISAGRVTDSTGVLDADSTPTLALSGVDTRSEKQLSQEFQLLSPSGGPLKWIVGAYLYYNISKSDPASVFGSTFSGPPFFATRIDNFSTMETKSIAGFGQATYDLTNHTHVTGGLRYTYDHRRQDGHVDFIYPTGPGPAPAFLGLGVNNFPTASFKALTGKFTLSQDVTDHIMAYGGYSRGFKSGIFNNLLVLSNPQPALQPEHMDAYEIGVKTDLLDRRLRINISGFYYKYNNLVVNVYSTFNIAPQNAASSTIKGVDGDVQFALTKSTRLTGGFSLLDATFDKYPNAALYAINPITSFNPANFGYGGVIISQLPNGADGNILPQAPKFSGFIGINQKIETKTGSLNLNGTVNYQSKVYFTPDNLYAQHGYANISASAKWTSRDGKWDVTLWARNLTDYYSVATVSVSGYLVAGIPNEPRSFGGRVGVHF